MYYHVRDKSMLIVTFPLREMGCAPRVVFKTLRGKTGDVSRVIYLSLCGKIRDVSRVVYPSLRGKTGDVSRVVYPSLRGKIGDVSCVVYPSLRGPRVVYIVTVFAPQVSTKVPQVQHTKLLFVIPKQRCGIG